MSGEFCVLMYMISESGFEAVCTAALHTVTVTIGVFFLCVQAQEHRLDVSNLLSWTNIGQPKKNRTFAITR